MVVPRPSSSPNKLQPGFFYDCFSTFLKRWHRITSHLFRQGMFLELGFGPGRCGELMVSAFVSGSSGPGSSHGRGTLCCVPGQDT